MDKIDAYFNQLLEAVELEFKSEQLEFQEKIKHYFERDFSESMLAERKKILQKQFDNETNAKKIVSCLNQ